MQSRQTGALCICQMIIFHNDKLVPPELCKLLYQTVPEEYHVPVVFNVGKHEKGIRGMCYWTHIVINLHAVFGHWGSYSGSFATFLWRELLGTCYHEFGHVATEALCADISDQEYEMEYAARFRVEQLANDWRDRRLSDLMYKDARLGQPMVLTGYMGAYWWRRLQLIGKNGRGCGEGSSKAEYVKEIRCLKSGGQFTVSDVLNRYGFYPWLYRNARRKLQGVAGDIGVVYEDAAGRKHKLFTYGDLPILEERLKALKLKPSFKGSTV